MHSGAQLGIQSHLAGTKTIDSIYLRYILSMPRHTLRSPLMQEPGSTWQEPRTSHSAGTRPLQEPTREPPGTQRQEELIPTQSH